MKYELTTKEIFIIPYNDRYILYAPLIRLSFLVNQDALELLSLIKNGKIDDCCERKYIKNIIEFEDCGIVNGQCDFNLENTIERFNPISVKLFLTYDCNLRCKYCYSMGGDNPLYMEKDIAYSAIDLLLSNLVQTGKDTLFIRFHGAGEPTLNFEVMKNSVEYAKKKSKELNFKTVFSLTSNCTFDQIKAKWIVENMSHVNASLDGIAEVHNYHRPMVSGEDSFEKIIKNLNFFDSLNFPYEIRSTVSEISVDRLCESVDFFCRELKPRKIHLEPVSQCGRAIISKIKQPKPQEFVTEYFKAKNLASKKYKVDLYHSGADLDLLTSSFCGASGHNFVVLPDGNVTSCFDVCRIDDKRSDIFFYGFYDTKSSRFKFNEEKLRFLSNRTVYIISECKNCFIKYHCGGECWAKACLTDTPYKPDKNRCWINREIAKEKLISMFEK